MKRFYLNGFRFFLPCLLAFFAACSGNDGEIEVEYPDDGAVRIKADKKSIVADGAETVTFSVHYGSKDISEDQSMNLVVTKESGEEVNMALGAHAFSTTVAGTYKIKARYYYGKELYSDEVTVTATAISGGKDYYHKVLTMQFTSVGCTNCPTLSAALKNIQTEKPGRLAVASFHMNYDISDPMALPETNKYRVNVLGNFGGLPRCFFNMRPGGDMISIQSQITQKLEEELANYPATCGVAIASTYNAGTSKVSVTAKVTSNTAAGYRCIVYLVEDGINYMQLGVDGGTYQHNNVVRAVLSASGSLYGDFLPEKPVKAGEETSMTFDATLNANWKADNMRVIVCALNSLDGGKSYTCNNVNECKLGASADYLYNK